MIVDRSAAQSGHTQPLPSIPPLGSDWGQNGATYYAAAASLRRKIDDERSQLLKRIASIYLVAGITLSISVIVIAALEMAGINAFDGPPTSPAVQTFNEDLIRPGGTAAVPQHQFPSALSAHFTALIQAHLASAGADMQAGAASDPDLELPQPGAPGSPPAGTGSIPLARGESAAHKRSPVVRMMISAVGIDAPVVIRGLDESGVMETGGAFEVAWYDFASHPASRGNAVFAGHVDYADIGPAVFWELGSLQANDDVVLTLADGTHLTYRVTAMTTIPVDADQAHIAAVTGPTSEPSVTLITCAGSFDADLRRYDERLVVRAVRVNSP